MLRIFLIMHSITLVRILMLMMLSLILARLRFSIMRSIRIIRESSMIIIRFTSIMVDHLVTLLTFMALYLYRLPKTIL
ncbi:hypothetical protein XaFJ1_GM000231 [Xanthomonas albilineans]|nr:hypothetical protein XalbCFBP2523_05290 [Xanthomonas albilineans]QHQ26993.1 hypothetical protein XaFJ1_GM000231 [Xanthomonas albilineans]